MPPVRRCGVGKPRWGRSGPVRGQGMSTLHVRSTALVPGAPAPQQPPQLRARSPPIELIERLPAAVPELPPSQVPAADLVPALPASLPRQMVCSKPLLALTDHSYAASSEAPSAHLGVEVSQSSAASSPSVASRFEYLPPDDVVDLSSDIEVGEKQQAGNSGAVYVRNAIDADTDATTTDNLPELTNRLDDNATDRCSFNWVNDLTAFRGVRETFTGIPGPTFEFTEMDPVDVFLKFWDVDIIDVIVTETNRYAEAYLRAGVSRFARTTRWKPTDRAEIYTFFAIMIHQSLTPVTVEKHYWSNPSRISAMPWKEFLTYDRWLLLKKFLHFADDSLISDSLSLDERKLYKIQPIIDHLSSKFRTLYLPNQNIALYESLLKWFGHLTSAQRISAKAGLKSYELCETQTGYLWNFSIYVGKDAKRADASVPMTDIQTDQAEPIDSREGGSTEGDTDTAGQTDRHAEAPQGVTAKIVIDLASELFCKGHTIVMDCFCNSPLLARRLKMHGMDCYGTLQLNRDGVPESLKSLTKASLNTGNILCSTSGDVNVVMWKDIDLVNMLSTYHANTAGVTEKYGTSKHMPTVVVDYNATMGAVDKKDQLLAGFPLERKRNLVWYKKLFGMLLNASILNAHVIYRRKDLRVEHREFRRQVADSLLDRFCPAIVRPSTAEPVRMTGLLPGYMNRARPVLENNHFSVKIDETSSKRKVCEWCKLLKKQNKTTRKCDICDVPLCVDCMKPYHTGVSPKSS